MRFSEIPFYSAKSANSIVERKEGYDMKKNVTFKTRNKVNAENWERTFRRHGLIPKKTYIVDGDKVTYLLTVPNKKGE